VGLIICGDQDPYCPVESIKSVEAELACRLDIIPNADHFFQSRENDLAGCISDFIPALEMTGPLCLTRTLD